MKNNIIIKNSLLLLAQIALLTCCVKSASARNEDKTADSIVGEESMENNNLYNTKRIMSYNVENLFDTKDDPETADDDFTPKGAYHWSQERYETKLQHIAKVITSLGEGIPPMLVGLMEIENEYVLRGLTQFSPLKKFRYKYVHKDSPDPRGIDVALLYQPEEFKLTKTDFLTVNLDDNKSHTRDILYAQGSLENGDTLNVFVIHFPSRRDGQEATEWKRMKAASVLRKKVDEILEEKENAKIVIMGDFNDYPDNRSITETLNAKKPGNCIKHKDLYNLFAKKQEEGGICSHKQGKEWGMLDQIIVSGAMLDRQSDTHAKKNSGEIFKAQYLLFDNATQGTRPNRTYSGYTYHQSGYSDHLPVFFDIIEK